MQRSVLRDILHTFYAQCFRSHVAIQTAFIFGLILRACSAFYQDPLKIALGFTVLHGFMRYLRACRSTHLWILQESLLSLNSSGLTVQGRTSCAIASPSQQQRCAQRLELWTKPCVFLLIRLPIHNRTYNSTTYTYGVRIQTDWPRPELPSDGGCIHLLARSQSWFAETRLLLTCVV